MRRAPFAGAAVLGDEANNWLDVFKDTSIHGVFLMASPALICYSFTKDNQTKINAQVNYIETLYGTDITKLYSIQGNIRPPPSLVTKVCPPSYLPIHPLILAVFGYTDGVAYHHINSDLSFDFYIIE